MRIQSFEDVIAWQMGRDLYIELFKEFKDTKDYFFRDQILRASVSITNNIAEGFDRGTDRELRQFLIIARGSCAEVRSMLHLAQATTKMADIRYQELAKSTITISKLLTGFANKLVTSDKRQGTK